MRVVATAGHVDHGKSTLVLALTGTDPDRFAEEKARGLTIDLGFAFTTLPSGTEVGFVDVPGHVRFVKNMLAGVGAVDVALLVVAANEGWMPQTAEHVAILELLGVRHGLVAVTKADLVDAETLELAQLELADHLEATPLATGPSSASTASAGAASTSCAPRSTRCWRARRTDCDDRAPAAVGRPGLLRRGSRAPSSPARSPAARSRSTTKSSWSRARAAPASAASSRTARDSSASSRGVASRSTSPASSTTRVRTR